MWFMLLEKKGVRNLSKYSRLIFVCTGNTCRSPMAEVLFRASYDADDIEVFSRGLVVLFPEPCNPKADLVVKNHNLSLEEHIATQRQKSGVNDETLVLCMTFSQKLKLMEEYGLEANLYTIKEYAGEEGDVLDPYGQTMLEYEECFMELSRLMKKTVIRLNKTEEK